MTCSRWWAWTAATRERQHGDDGDGDADLDERGAAAGQTGVVVLERVGPLAHLLDRPQHGAVGSERQQFGSALEGVDHPGP